MTGTCEPQVHSARRFKQAVGRALIPRLPIGRRSFDILRFEFGCLARRARNAVSPRYRSRVRRLRAQRGISLNLGSGGQGLPGWINIDARWSADCYIACDIRRGLPLRDGQVRRIFAEHVVEHLDFRGDVPALFREFRRVLEPGGTVRIIVPDAGRFAEAYASPSREPAFLALGWDLADLPDDIYTPMHVLNHVFHQSGEHLFGWDFETMQLLLTCAGFANVIRQEFRVSSDPDLAIDQPVHRAYSLVVEAQKEPRD